MISLIFPVFNKESELIPSLTRVTEVLKEEDLYERFEFILVDDGSKDRSRDRISEFSNRQDNVRMVFLDHNQGKGAALLAGFAKASPLSEIIGFMDADLDISPDCIKSIIQHLDSDMADFVIGSKYHRDSNVVVSLKRRVMSRVFRITMKSLIGLNVSDTQTGIKFFKKDFLNTINAHEFNTTSFAFDVELLVLAVRNQLRVTEHPIDMKKEFKSSIGLKNGLMAFIDLVVIRRSFKKNL